MGALRTSIAGAVVGTVAATGLYTGVVGPAVTRTSATSADGSSLAAAVPHAPKVVVTVKAHRATPVSVPTTQDVVEANKAAQAPAPPAAGPAAPAAPAQGPKHRPSARATAEGRRAASHDRSTSSSTSSSGGSHGSSEPQDDSGHEAAEPPETEDHGGDSDD